MDKIIQGIIFDGQVRVSIVDTSQILSDSVKKFSLSPLETNALGRALCIGAYVSYNIKGNKSRFNLLIESEGIIEKVCVVGESKGMLKGFVRSDETKAERLQTTDLRIGLGKNGYLTMIKDLGLKKPYIGRTELISGNIADDFAYYLYKSEGVKNAVGLDVIQDNGRLFSFGMVFESLPDATEDAIFIAEDIISQFDDICRHAFDKGIEEIFEYYLGHLNSKILAVSNIEYYCDCRQRAPEIIKSLGKEEIKSIIEELGKVELICEYCNNKICYKKEQLEEILGQKF